MARYIPDFNRDELNAMTAMLLRTAYDLHLKEGKFSMNGVATQVKRNKFERNVEADYVSKCLLAYVGTGKGTFFTPILGPGKNPRTKFKVTSGKEEDLEAEIERLDG